MISRIALTGTCAVATLTASVQAQDIEVRLTPHTSDAGGAIFQMARPLEFTVDWSSEIDSAPMVQALRHLEESTLLKRDDTISMALRAGASKILAEADTAPLGSYALMLDSMGMIAGRYQESEPLVLDVTIFPHMNDFSATTDRTRAMASMSGDYVSDGGMISVVHPYKTMFSNTDLGNASIGQELAGRDIRGNSASGQWYPAGQGILSNHWADHELWFDSIPMTGNAATNSTIHLRAKVPSLSGDDVNQTWVHLTMPKQFGYDRFTLSSLDPLKPSLEDLNPAYGFDVARSLIDEDIVNRLEQFPGIFVPTGQQTISTPKYNPWGLEQVPTIFTPPRGGSPGPEGENRLTHTAPPASAEIIVGTKPTCKSDAAGISMTDQSGTSAAICPGSDGFHDKMRDYADMLVNNLMDPKAHRTERGQAAVNTFPHRMYLVERRVRSFSLGDDQTVFNLYYTIVRVILPAEAVVEDNHSEAHGHWLAFDITMAHQLLPYVGPSADAWNRLRFSGLPIIDLKVDALLWKKRAAGDSIWAAAFGRSRVPDEFGFENLPSTLRLAVEETIADRLRRTSFALASAALDRGMVKVELDEPTVPQFKVD